MVSTFKRVLLFSAAFVMSWSLAVPAAHAAGRIPRKLAVHVVCSCDDAMGKAYVAAFTDALSKDGRYDVQTANETDGAIRISIISMPITTATGQPGDAFSIVCVHNSAMMHQFVTTCAHLPVDACARSMVSSLADLED